MPENVIVHGTVAVSRKSPSFFCLIFTSFCTSFTGGDFNRTAVVTFPAKTGKVTVTQRATGNAKGFMLMDTELNGDIPLIPENSKVTVDEFTQEYRRESQGAK